MGRKKHFKRVKTGSAGDVGRLEPYQIEMDLSEIEADLEGTMLDRKCDAIRVKRIGWYVDAAERAMVRFTKLLFHDAKPAEWLTFIREDGIWLYRAIMYIADTNMRLSKQIEQMKSNYGKNSNRRWTREDDEDLIEYITADIKPNIIGAALNFGRTPGAIESRLTYLVGINKVSQAVAGRFIGTVNGVDASVVIDGVVFKEQEVTA